MMNVLFGVIFSIITYGFLGSNYECINPSPTVCVWEFATSPFYFDLGMGSWFVLLPNFALLVYVYQKTQNPGLVAAAGLIAGSALGVLAVATPSEGALLRVQEPAIILIGFSVAILIWNTVFRAKEG
jgi:hypothetical protein